MRGADRCTMLGWYHVMPAVLSIYALMSAVAFGLYRIDKQRAARGDWRVREITLHVVALLGGWPGALAAQRVFRHKTSKRSFLIVFWTIVALHAFAWAWWLDVQY